MRAVSFSDEAVETLWTNQQVMNGRALEAVKDIGMECPEISESLVRDICRHILVPPKVWVRPMTKPTEILQTPEGKVIEGPFFALTRKMATRWCGDVNRFAFGIAREITSEMFFDVVRAEDEATKKRPFYGLIYAPFVLVMLRPIKLGKNPDIGAVMRYSKRLVCGTEAVA